MGKNLTTSDIERQNILNNPFALQEIQKATHLKGLEYKGQFYLTKEQVAGFFEVDIRTIERYLDKNSQELKNNGYAILRGTSLQKLKLFLKDQAAPDINVGSKMKDGCLFSQGRKRMKLCKCGKRAVMALNGQWFCLNCFNKDNKGIVKIVKQSVKRAMDTKRKRA